MWISAATGKQFVIQGIMLASLALLLPGVAVGSPSGPTLLSQTTWGGANSDGANGVAVASDGSAYVVGTTDSFTTDSFGQPSALSSRS